MDEPRASVLIAQGDREQALAPILSREGYRVVETRDARPFLIEYSRMKPDLVVLDSDLPGGDAYLLCARVNEGGRVAILMLVPNNDEEIDRAYRMGAYDVLIKPINPTIFCHRVRTFAEAHTFEERARSYDRRWQQTFERNRAVQLIVNPQNGQIVDANPAACSFYGYSRDEFQGKLIVDLDVPTGTNIVETTLFNFRHRTASGQLRDVKIFSNPIDYGGKTLLFLVIIDVSKVSSRDTAPPALAEALRNTAAALSELNDQDEMLDRILEQVSLTLPNDAANIMLIEDGIARIERARGYLNGKQSALERIRMDVHKTPALRWMIENNRALSIANTDHYDGWVDFDVGGSWQKSYAAAPIRVGNKVIGFLNIDSNKPNRFNESDAENLQVFADQAAVAIRSGALIEHVRYQANLEQHAYQRGTVVEYERSQMRAIIDAMTEGVAYTEYIDDEYHTRYINHALEVISGYSADDWNRYSLNLLRPKGMTDEAFERMLNGAGAELNSKGYWRHDVKLCRQDGTEYDAMTITSRVESKDPDMVSLVTVVRDVSKEKLLQQQKEHFVSYASHELRTPITNLKTRLYLLRNQPERLDEHLVVLEYVTDRMKRLVEDLLDISRFERGVIKLNFRDIVLQDVISNLVRVQTPEADSKRLQLRCELPDTPIRVDADPERLAQVITNLVTNAINYTPTGGRITLRLSHFHDVTGDLALVEIEDTGVGISEEHLPHIFQPFYRIASEVEGSGLGLSISKEIIELHGGEIDVTSEYGVGTTFCFWLPMLLNRVGDFRVNGAR